MTANFTQALALLLAMHSVTVNAKEPASIGPVTLDKVTIDTPITTHHRGLFNHQRVAYDATVEAFTATAIDGKPAARLVSTSYVATPGSVERPVIFAFNGGPIAASTPLHFGLLGPKRLDVPDDLNASASTFKLIDNAYSPLDVADIVIFDPASTGYSRVVDGVQPSSQFSTQADA
ncbi:MAG: hypothetical protein ABI858_12005, partial [Pseudoxanthomonas sp.]